MIRLSRYSLMTRGSYAACYTVVNTLGMIIRMYCIIYAISVHYEHRM